MLYIRDGTQYIVETQLAMRKTVMDATFLYVWIPKRDNGFIILGLLLISTEFGTV